MDILEFAVLAIAGFIASSGLAVACSLLLNWPGRTPADPE